MYFNNKKRRYFYVPPIPWRRQGYPHGLFGGSFRPGENAGFLVGSGVDGDRKERLLARVEEVLNFVDKQPIKKAQATGQPVEISENLYDLMREINENLKRQQKSSTNGWDALKSIGKYGAITAGIALPSAAYVLGKPHWNPKDIAILIKVVRGIKGLMEKFGDKIVNNAGSLYKVALWTAASIFHANKLRAAMTIVRHGLPIIAKLLFESTWGKRVILGQQPGGPPGGVPFTRQQFANLRFPRRIPQVSPNIRLRGGGAFNMGAGLRQKLVRDAIIRRINRQKHLMIC